MGEIIYILFCLIFVLDICCDTTNIYKLSETLRREERQTTIWIIPKYIKSYFLYIVFVLESYQAILQFTTLFGFGSYFYINGWISWLCGLSVK